jgi:hypothetical protein
VEKIKKWLAGSFFEKLRSQGPKRFPTSLGILIPKVRHNIPTQAWPWGNQKTGVE